MQKNTPSTITPSRPQNTGVSEVAINTRIKDSVPLMRVKRDNILRKLEQANKEGASEAKEEKTHDLMGAGSKLTTELENEIWEVKALDIDIKMPSQPSRVLESLLESRRARHEQAEADLYRDLEAVNQEAEEVILDNAGPLKDEIKELSEAAQSVYDEIKEKPLADIQKNLIEDAYSEIEALYSKRKEHLHRYARSLMDVEDNRSKKSKLVFRKYAKLFNQIAHKFPYENQEFFEHEILKYNQVVLNNIRNYGDVHKQLVLSGEDELQRYRKKLNNIDHQWKEIKRVEARKFIENTSALSILAETQARFREHKEVQEIEQNLSDERNGGLFEGLIARWLGHGDTPFTSANVDEWSDQLTRTVMHLESCSQQILTLYTNALVEVIDGIKKELGITDVSVYKDDIYSTREVEELHELFKPICDNVMELHKDELNHLQLAWQHVIAKMKESLSETECFLKDAALVWEHHFERLEACMKTVTAGMSTSVESDYRGLDEKEVKLNIAIDNLRQEVTEAKLDKGLANIKTILDEIEACHVACYESQNATIKMYPDMISAELDVLTSEVLVFTDKYPRSTHVSGVGSVMEIRRFRSSLEITPTYLMGRELKLCEYQLTAVKNWRLGLWESMEHYADTCKDDMMAKAWEWVNSQSLSTFHVLECKLVLHSPRYNRIKQEVYNVRLTELTSHRYRLDCHKKAIKLHINEISKDLADLSKNANYLKEELEAKIQEATEYCQSALRCANVVRTVNKMDELLETYIREVKNVTWEFMEESDNKISWLRESNVDFMQAITLFSEGGNFSARESEEYMTELQDVDSFVDDQEGANIKEVDSQETNLIKQARIAVNKFKNEMKPIQAELAFGELVIGLIKGVQADIKKEVIRMKSDGQTLCQHVDQLKDELIGPFTPWTLHDLLDTVLDHCMARRYYLLQPQIVEGEMVKEEAGLKFYGFDIEPEAKDNLTRVTDRFLDYREILFGSKSPPPDEDRFLLRVCYNMWKTFGQIQEAACDFYGSRGKKPLTRPDLLQPVYDDFIEELLLKFKYYHVQCEEVWLDQAQVYIVLIAKLKEMVNECVTKTLSKFHSDQLEAMHRIQVKNLKQVGISESLEYESRLALHNKLKPLHGYPGNRHLLEELNSLAYQTSQDLQDQVNKQLEDISVAYRELQGDYQPKLEAIVQPLRLLVAKVFDPRLTATLIEQIEEVYMSVLDRAEKSRREADALDLPELPEVITTASDVAGWKDGLMLKRMHEIVNSPIVEEGEKVSGQRVAQRVPRQHILSIEHDAYYAKSVLTRLEILRKEMARVTRVDSELSDMNILATKEGEKEGETDVGEMEGEMDVGEMEGEMDVGEMEGEMDVGEMEGEMDTGETENGEEGEEEGDGDAKEEGFDLPAVDIDEIVQNLVKELDDKYEAGLAAILDKQEVHTGKSLHQKFIDKWEISVKKVKELYACRFEEYEAMQEAKQKELETETETVTTATTT